MGSIPSADELVDAIRAAPYTEAEWRMLSALHSGDAREQDDEAPEVGELDDFQLYGIIGCNSFGEEFTDFATTFARSRAGQQAAPQLQDQKQQMQREPRAEQDSGQGQPTYEQLYPLQSEQRREAELLEGQLGHLGLFPTFSMLNHSCLPNAVNFVVGGSMVVVASRAIPKGAEVLINYLGRSSLRPVEERQAQLAEGYHFACDCPRCRIELLANCVAAGGATPQPTATGTAASEASFGDAVQALVSRCADREDALSSMPPPGAPSASASAAVAHRQEMSGATSAASTGGSVEADGAVRRGQVGPISSPSCAAPCGAEGQSQSPDPDSPILERLLWEVRQDVGGLEDLLQRTISRLPPDGPGVTDTAEAAAVAAASTEREQQLRLWLRASVFDLLSQHVALAEATGRRQEALAALEAQVTVCEAVAPHSDLHMYLAVKRLAMVQEARAAASREPSAGQDSQGAKADEDAELRRCMAVVRGRYGLDLSDATAALLLEGAVYGLSQVVV